MKKLIAVAAIALALGGCATASPSHSVDSQGVFDLSVGDCFNGGTVRSETTSMPTIDCSSRHEFEVYHSEQLDAGAFPGAQQTATEADASCAAAFEDFLGESFDAAHTAGTFDFTSLYPTAASWNLGDREILCAIAATAGGRATKTVGTLRGAGR